MDLQLAKSGQLDRKSKQSARRSTHIRALLKSLQITCRTRPTWTPFLSALPRLERRKLQGTPALIESSSGYLMK